MKHNWMLAAAAFLLYVSWSTGGGGVLPNDSPVDVDSPHVLVVWEQNDSGEMGREQVNVISSFRTKSELYDLVVNAGGEQPRVYDDDTNIDNLPEPWKEMMNLERGGLPWIVIATPTDGTSEGLPESVEATKELIEEYL